jgi:hypothetical protein
VKFLTASARSPTFGQKSTLQQHAAFRAHAMIPFEALRGRLDY